MQRVVFYSWQSDSPNATNRTLIEEALKSAAKSIADDSSIDVEPVVDRDTQGLAGAPDISKAIFAKIAAADVFVADISIVGKYREGRFSPNPNVLLELGYALKALGEERIILVLNDAYGKPDQLPFDLRARRVLVYSEALEPKSRGDSRRQLASSLKAALRAAFATIQPVDEPSPSLAAMSTSGTA